MPATRVTSRFVGLELHATRFVLFARDRGVRFDRTATIGRQSLLVTRRQLRTVFEKFAYSCDQETLARVCPSPVGYADDLFRALGARDVTSFDYSDYEGASQIHDMNQPIPESFRRRYSAVLDFGSLEHVFNLPVALKNCMEMVEVGGHFLMVTPANNFMGHGFYQFSPELFFSVFDSANGFELFSVIACEEHPEAVWHSVASPKSIHGRVTLSNHNPLCLMVVAKRVADVEPFRTTPQQSDYQAIWSVHAGVEEKRRPAAVRWLAKWTPGRIKRGLRSLLGRARGVGERIRPRPAFDPSEFDPRFFQPIDPSEGVSSAGKRIRWDG